MYFLNFEAESHSVVHAGLQLEIFLVNLKYLELEACAIKPGFIYSLNILYTCADQFTATAQIYEAALVVFACTWHLRV